MDKKITIPAEIQEVCKDIAKVLRRHRDKMHKFKGEFSPRGMEWGSIQFYWDTGRHNDGVGEITITSNMRVETKIDE